MFAVPRSYPHRLAHGCRATTSHGTSCSFCKCVTSGMMRSATVHKLLRCRSIAASHALAGA
eukprot:10211202-Alexandrium_andersonii.AAC.1